MMENVGGVDAGVRWANFEPGQATAPTRVDYQVRWLAGRNRNPGFRPAPIDQPLTGKQGQSVHGNVLVPLLPAQGVHPRIVQERPRHADIATTLYRYRHATPDMRRSAADPLYAAFSMASWE